MKRKYFGTDGVRGPVGSAPMTPDFALKLGWAAGRVLARTPGARVLIGKDTRRSGYMFESALEAGFAAAGVESDMLGPLPTPGVAYLTRALRAQAGVVISASHNPHHDNGVKFFGPDGGKLSDEVEAEIEALMEQPLECVPSDELGRARRIDDAQGRYIEFCKSSFPLNRSLKGMRVAIDCANGAAYRTGPAVFAELGAQTIVIGDRPDGLNINQDCGSTHLDALKRVVSERKADLGIALDGDADRCLMVTAGGDEIDGDEILYIIARSRLASGDLKGPVVGTQMSNLGLERAFEALGISFKRAKVGDRYVLEMLKEHGGSLGGETSGHTLCLDRTTTGDGTITALQVLAAIMESGRSLADLAAGMSKFPQVLINVRLAGAADRVMAAPSVKAAVIEAEAKLAGRGRVLLRPSGTEPLIRVMVEAQDAAETQAAAAFIADHVRAVAA
ncbi:phosphoglucosamine mutase [Panacagrimonas perspica]|uniref:Phosphoglucosamine mutase n=1 Tax=Panacagrimonas perspica TaxID=381431 RepID=A0A4V3UQZ8_9GAMM|nr:phosphoglucosamine mutase [Panacagrimonas perspica]TDU32815.1 phosphoglucosamine mutase [Panacagrimonas perspica]THD00931.1 phosphoglucosamine mutase [Panacagrimonas perspica]